MGFISVIDRLESIDWICLLGLDKFSSDLFVEISNELFVDLLFIPSFFLSFDFILISNFVGWTGDDREEFVDRVKKPWRV